MTAPQSAVPGTPAFAALPTAHEHPSAPIDVTRAQACGSFSLG